MSAPAHRYTHPSTYTRTRSPAGMPAHGRAHPRTRTRARSRACAHGGQKRQRQVPPKIEPHGMSRQRPPATPKSSPKLVVVDRISTPDFRSTGPLVVDDFGQPATPENGACRHVIFFPVVDDKWVIFGGASGGAGYACRCSAKLPKGRCRLRQKRTIPDIKGCVYSVSLIFSPHLK